MRIEIGLRPQLTARGRNTLPGLNRFGLVSLALVLCFLAPAVAQPAPPQAHDTATQIDGWLRNLNGYKRYNDTVWSINRSGKALGEFKVIVALNDQGMAVIFVIIAKDKQMQKTSALMQEMLKLNHRFDFVKIGFDDDGDAFVRADMASRVLDQRSFTDMVDQVAKSSDETFDAIKQFIAR